MKKLITILFLLTCFLEVIAQGNESPTKWHEWLTNGDAEIPWTEEQKTTRWDDQTKNHLICAWAMERGINLDDKGKWKPFPATIEEDTDGNHYFVVHGKPATTEGDASAWDNQFWIQSPKSWKTGEKFKLHFRYKASKDAKVSTQVFKQNPSVYQHWSAIGDISFTEKWQDYEGKVIIDEFMDGGWSIGFLLNQEDKDAINFYFDDLSWQNVVLEDGLFVASYNTETGTNYDFDHTIEFKAEGDLMVATVGVVGMVDTYVNRMMISTVRGDDDPFKESTIMPVGKYIGEGIWGDYAEASNASIKLPSAGVWKISIDSENRKVNIVKVEEIDPQKPKCATPDINYTSGKITFSCETEGVEYISDIKCEDIKKYNVGEITLTHKYNVSVYATKPDYNNSDVATREIVIENGQYSLFGDLNKDGKVNVADHVKLSEIIMNK